MNVNHPEFQNAIAAIRVGFISTLGQHLQNLTQLYQKILAQDFANVALEKIHEIAHKIRGVAKTLQFDELGQIAAKVELALAPIGTASISAQQISHVTIFIEELIACITAIVMKPDASSVAQ